MPTFTSRSCFFASVSVRPHQAISGSVKTTAGIAAGPRGGRFARDHLDGELAFMGRLVGQHRLAGHVADGEEVRHVRAPLCVDLDEALLVQLDAGLVQAEFAVLGRRPTATSTCSKIGFLDVRFALRSAPGCPP